MRNFKIIGLTGPTGSGKGVVAEYLASKGGKVILNGDSHEVGALGFNFEKSIELLRKCGFKSVFTITKDGKKELEI